jgi:hypothetical protein
MVIHDGPGGTGKSTLAYVWMKRDVVGEEIPLPPDSPAEAKRSRVSTGWQTGLNVLWFSFYSEEGGGDFYDFLGRAIEHFSDHIKRPEDYRRGVNVDWSSMAEDVRKLVANQHSLIIWDGAERLLHEYTPAAPAANVRRSFLFKGDAYQSRLCADWNIAKFLWGLSSCVNARMLILSRVPFADLENRPARQVQLKGLTPDAAVDFLKRRGVQGLDRELRKCAADYCYHPLSLSNLAAAITSDFATNGNIRDAPKFKAGIPMDRRRRHVLEVAFNKRAPHLQELLSRLAAISGLISPELVTLVSSDIDQLGDHTLLGPNLFELSRHGLLNKQRDEAGYGVHPVVREYAYERLIDKRAIHDRLAEHYRVQPAKSGNSPVDRPWLDAAEQYFHHLARANRYQDAYEFFYYSKANKQCGRDLNHILFYELGKYHDYINLLSELFPSGSGSLPTVKNILQPFVVNDLALAYGNVGNLKAAKSLLEQGYGVAYELVQGAKLYSLDWTGGNNAMGLCLEGLGNVKLRLGDLKAAEQDLLRSIGCYSNLLLAAERQRLAGMENIRIGDIERGKRDLEFSQMWYKQYHKVISFPFRHLAKLRICCGNWEEVKALYETVRKERKTAGSQEYFYDILLTWAELQKKDISSADQCLRFAEAAFQKLDSSLQYQRWGSEMKYLRGEISLAQGEIGDAEVQFNAVLSGSRLSGDLEQESKALLALAKVSFARALRSTDNADFVGLSSQARDLAYQAEALAERCGYALVLSDIHLFLSNLSAKLKDANSGRRHAIKARTLASCGYRRPTRKSRIYRAAYEEARLLLSAVRGNKPH